MNQEQGLKSDEMAKFKVRYSVKDGVDPVNYTGLFKLMSPLSFTLDPGSKLSLGVGVNFDCSLLIFEDQSTRRQGVELVNSCSIVNGDPVLLLHNTSEETAFFEIGETLCTAIPLIDNFSLERK